MHSATWFVSYFVDKRIIIIESGESAPLMSREITNIILKLLPHSHCSISNFTFEDGFPGAGYHHT